MKINLTKVKDYDLSYVEKYYPEKYKIHKINEMNVGHEDGEHYKLLSFFSDLFTDELILDLGTRDGLSALCLSWNQKNSVITYDLSPKPVEMENFESLIPNCEFKQMNVFDEDIETIKKSKLIFLDLDPHDGVQEKKFMDILNDINYKGIVICDDIKWFSEMSKWWNEITTVKYDVTNFGHGSGTGIIDFSNELEIVYE